MKQRTADVQAHGSQAPPAAETLHTTDEHPFLTTDRGFVSAEDLRIGEQIRQLDGGYGVVVALQHIFGVAVRYNLTVQDDHTYAVVADQWVVHNCGQGGKPNPEQQLKDQNGNSQNFYTGQQRENLRQQGFKLFSDKIRQNTSSLFKKFVEDTFGSYNDDDWEYHMEEYRGRGQEISNHYWSGKIGTIFEDIFSITTNIPY